MVQLRCPATSSRPATRGAHEPARRHLCPTHPPTDLGGAAAARLGRRRPDAARSGGGRAGRTHRAPARRARVGRGGAVRAGGRGPQRQGARHARARRPLYATGGRRPLDHGAGAPGRDPVGGRIDRGCRADAGGSPWPARPVEPTGTGRRPAARRHRLGAAHLGPRRPGSRGAGDGQCPRGCGGVRGRRPRGLASGRHRSDGRGRSLGGGPAAAVRRVRTARGGALRHAGA